jgi:hypothetical protein
MSENIVTDNKAIRAFLLVVAICLLPIVYLMVTQHEADVKAAAQYISENHL